MNIDSVGQVAVNELELMEALYSGKITTLNRVYVSTAETAERYNESVRRNRDRLEFIKAIVPNNLSVAQYDAQARQIWLMPPEYQNFDIQTWLRNQCKTEVETSRVNLELTMFAERNLIMVLNYLRYLVDVMRSNGVVWGVGRGSSVASYCLYLIGVHRIDSIAFDLDIKEFLKETE